MKDFLQGIVYVGLFAIPFIPLIVVDSMFFPFITGKNFTFRIIVEIVFVAWALLALLDPRYRPRFSWLLGSFSILLVVMFFANIFGVHPQSSFWSNFERMDGYVTLVHVFLLTVVLGSTFQTRKMWTYFLATSVVAASYVAFDGLQQYINKEGSWRIDSTLGNASYMAVYMFFHAFFSVWLFVQSRQWWVRTLLVIAFVLFSYLLILTATRGTFLALAGGLSLSAVYLMLFAQGHVRVRQVAAGGLVTVLLLVGSVFVFKDTAFVSENVILDRIASISLEELSGRFAIWGMAWEGIKERPLLGYGQSNFNYVFNAKYNPEIYYGESWYDRVHNLALDWLIAGGFIGFFAYAAIYIAIFYYLLVRPALRGYQSRRAGTAPPEEDFTVVERAILLGMVAGYVIHNLVVFDNIVSYIFFAVMLGLIQSRIGEVMPKVQAFSLDPRIVTNIIAPTALVVMGTVIYFVNVPAIQAASDIIVALRANTIPTRLAAMEQAVDRGSFAYQEVVEQLAQQAMQLTANQQIAPEQKRAYVDRAEKELLNLEKVKPDDARVHVFISGFYRTVSALPESKKHIDIARDLSPTKPAILLEQGILAYQLQDFEAMHQYFKDAFELEQKYTLARIFYATSFLYINQPERVEEFITEEYFDRFAANEFAIQSVGRFKQNELLARMFAVRINTEPQNAQHRASLAFLLNENKQVDEAIVVLEQAAADIPSFASTSLCYAANLRAGNPPSQNCQ